MPVALFARFPRLFHRPQHRPVIPPGTAERHPVLAGDLADLESLVTPVFTDYDQRAQHEQNTYRRQQLLILCGAAAITVLGGVQALFPGQRWPGLLLTVAGVLLATSSQWARERASLQDYLDFRVRAERLRALYFRYLTRVGPYSGPDRRRALRRAVLAVRTGKEPE
ncbi:MULTISPECIES: DUF4231 domain-containing protein [Actinoplanes]|uniref:DUF4231 domain-containing protein n=1 Tax=Actinoplanes TaxID=1865 RepID=UPI000A7A7584|nr:MULTISPECIES: DUF4231 domain-containing protein [Actinoplanes]GLY00315.1 hypothetical protein Acsp01_06940 [Actinoplanes sp. NBRC 101535]